MIIDSLRATEINNNNISAGYTFAELADKYGGSLYRFCRSVTYSREDADDLFQETFLKIFEQPDKISGSHNPRSFIFSTALYIWKSWKRKYARRKRIADFKPFDGIADAVSGETSIEEDYLAREEIRITRELVESLPEKLKIPIILCYTAEMSVQDIAAALKIPDGTVKSRLFNARKIIEKGLIELDK